MKKFVLMAAAALTVVSLACSCGKDKSSDKDEDTTETTKDAKTDNSTIGQIDAIVDQAIADMKAHPENAEAIVQDTQNKLTKIMDGIPKEEAEKLAQSPEFEAIGEKFINACVEIAEATQASQPEDMAEPAADPTAAPAEAATPAL